jgi:uncharacterized protein
VKVACPACRRETEFGPGNPARPFCSARCKSMDLGAWAAEDYRIPGETPDEETGLQPDEPSTDSVSTRRRA